MALCNRAGKIRFPTGSPLPVFFSVLKLQGELCNVNTNRFYNHHCRGTWKHTYESLKANSLINTNREACWITVSACRDEALLEPSIAADSKTFGCLPSLAPAAGKDLVWGEALVNGFELFPALGLHGQLIPLPWFLPCKTEVFMHPDWLQSPALTEDRLHTVLDFVVSNSEFSSLRLKCPLLGQPGWVWPGGEQRRNEEVLSK